jgi:hypothetical protein
MTDDEDQPIAVSRRICAPAHDIFQVLADPVRHPDFDGSDMLRGPTSAAVISGVGDVFVMKMYFSRLGDYEMNNHVVEYEQDRRIGWEPAGGRGYPSASPDNPKSAQTGQRWSYQLVPDGLDATVVTEIYDCSRVPEKARAGMDNGRMWIASMTRTLERLDALCAPRKPTGYPELRPQRLRPACGQQNRARSIRGWPAVSLKERPGSSPAASAMESARRAGPAGCPA